jgi:hypothetical protein
MTLKEKIIELLDHETRMPNEDKAELLLVIIHKHMEEDTKE